MSTTSGLRLSECTSATEKSTLRKEYVELIAKADVHMFEKLKKKAASADTVKEATLVLSRDTTPN